MAAPSKKRAVDEEMEIPDDEEDEEDDDDESNFDRDDGEEEEEDMLVNENVQVEFEARNAEDSDFHGIKKLLQQLFLKANINLSELTDTIISQNYIGSVIKQSYVSDEEDEDEDDDDDVFGVVTALNMTDRKELESVQQIRSFLLDKCSQCSSKEKREKFAAILDNPDNQVALLINERFINIPPQIALPSFESLVKEMERAVRKKMKYDFSHYLMISKSYRLPSSGKGSQQDSRTFVNAEEELFLKESELSFEYSVASEHDTCVGGTWDDDEEEFEPIRTVIVIPKSHLPAGIDSMKDFLALPPNS